MADKRGIVDSLSKLSRSTAANEDEINHRNGYVEKLYSQYQNGLRNYIAGMLPTGIQDTGEVLQETYIRLLRMEDIQKLEENPKAYIYTIATNIVRDNMRKRASRKQDAHVEFNEQECQPCDLGNPVNGVNFSESMKMLKEVLFALPQTTRDIFLLSRFEEMTYPEIANSVGVSTRTVERHMNKACRVLQDQFGGLV